MRHERLEKNSQESAKLGKAIVGLVETLSNLIDESGQSFKTDETIPGTDSTTAEVVSRIQTSVGLISKFSETHHATLVPMQVLNGMESSISSTESAVVGLVEQLETIEKLGRLKNFDYSNFRAQTNNNQNHDFISAFKNLYDHSESLMIHLFECLRIFEPSGSIEFQSAASMLSKLIADASDSLGEIKKQQSHLATTETEFASMSERAQSNAAEFERIKTEGASDRKTISDYLAEVTQQKANVNSINEEANSLQNSIKTYQKQFDHFQKQLDDREVNFSTGASRLENLIDEFQKQSKAVENLISRSEQMLSSATVSGLASNYAKIQEQLTVELWWARITFYVGIAFLTISAIPLLTFVLIPLYSAIYGDPAINPEGASRAERLGFSETENSWQYFGQVVARIAILLPAAWFVSFAAIRHSSLFRLREHYAYKYSMAVSVEGFKQQAPEYEQEIAAMVLAELAFNPADKLTPSKDVTEAKAPGVAGHFFDKLRARLSKQ